MKIEDNFLDQKVFDELQTFMMGAEIDWHYNDHVVQEDKNQYQFIHLFYMNHVPTSKFIKILGPIIDKIDIIALGRIKANLQSMTSNIIENELHVDLPRRSEEKLKQWTTSILYMNTNNGYTKFEDGTIVESVANRMVTFPGNMKHTGTSCTDKQTRIIINFN